MLKVMDTETGEVMSFAELKAGSRGPQKKLTKAFLNKYGTKASFWTLGTNYDLNWENLEKVKYDWDRMIRTWPFKECDWISVLEIGGKGGKMHFHILTSNFIKQEVLKEFWERFTGIKDVYVYVKQVYGDMDKAASYLTKYLTKQNMKGVRSFRSKKGLRLSLKDFYDESKEMKTYVRCD